MPDISGWNTLFNRQQKLEILQEMKLYDALLSELKILLNCRMAILFFEGHSQFINSGFDPPFYIKTHFFEDPEHRFVFHEYFSSKTE